MPAHRRAAMLLMVLLPLVLGGRNSTEEIAIIAHPSDHLSEISAEDLKAVFLGTKGSLKEAGQVKPVLMKGGRVHEAFLKEYLGKSDFALQTFYRSLIFSGQGSIPKTVSSDAEAIAYVSKTRGAIGYVDASAVTAGVRTILVR